MTKKPILYYKEFRNPETGYVIKVPVRDEEFVDPEDWAEAMKKIKESQH